MDNKRIIKDDIMRYKKNTLASTLTLLGLVFTVLYFALLYSVNDAFFYTITMGISVMVTLVLLLTAFLASESIKNYRKVYCIVLIVLAVLNIVRIFYYPLQGLQGDKFNGAIYFWTEMSSAGIFAVLVIYLVASAACYIAAAVIGYMNCTRLEKYEKAVADGTINIDAVLAEEERLAVGVAVVATAQAEVQEQAEEAETECKTDNSSSQEVE